MLKKDFRGEVWTNVDKGLMELMLRINSEEVDGKVGEDSYTAAAVAELQKQFEREIAVLWTMNGTAANIIALKALLSRFGSVIAAEQSHIGLYECGALEYNLGAKLLTARTTDAKLTPALIEGVIAEHKSHAYIPEVIAITQPTEMGTLYTVSELKAITDYAHSRGIRVFVDGARLGSALATLGISLGEMIGKTGIDAFTVGGTKAGAMLGEGVVFTDKSMLNAGSYILKQSMQHIDKSKFLGAQMLYLLEDDRWIKNFDHANKMAKMIEEGLTARGIEPYFPVESNMVFCKMEPELLEKIRRVYDLKYWFEDKKVVRICATFDTEESAVRELLSLLD